MLAGFVIAAALAAASPQPAPPSDLDCLTASLVRSEDPRFPPALKAEASEMSGFYFGRLNATDPNTNWLVSSAARRSTMSAEAAKPVAVACYTAYAATVQKQQAALPAEPQAVSAPRQGRRVTAPGGGTGQTVYSPSECIGAVVNGVCHGSILARPAHHPVCHGQMLNGVCTGPMF